MSASLVGSEMCIRDSAPLDPGVRPVVLGGLGDGALGSAVVPDRGERGVRGRADVAVGARSPGGAWRC
eukprot:12687136-Alexandrium_andersonii.AAC.1